MRLLSIGADHVGGGSARQESAPGRRRYRRGYGWQHLPLRHLCAHPRSHQERREPDVGEAVMSSKHICLSRRAALQSGLVGGLVLAFQWPLHAAPVNEPEQSSNHPDSQFVANAFIRIDETGKTTLVIPQAEMGQGVYTAIAMILAEELDADLGQVVLEHGPPSDKLYGNPLFGVQVTGNSNSIRAFWDKLREAGAVARAMLISAAAAQWQVDAASCSASAGKVAHAAS